MKRRRIDPIANIEASEYDRRWFAAHPGKTQYVRRPFPHERFEADYVLVTQIEPGIRLREGVVIEIDDWGDDVETKPAVYAG